MPPIRTTFPFILFLLATMARPQAMGNLMYERSMDLHYRQADQAVRATVHGNMLVLEVNAMMNTVADSYLAIFHLTQLGQSAAEADSLMERRIQAFKERVLPLGVKQEDFFPDMLSFLPVYELETTRKLFSTTYQEIPAGFEIQKNLHIRFRDARMLDRLVSAAAREEIYDLVKVDFFVADQGARFDTLRHFAHRLLQQKLTSFAKLGLNVEESHRNAGEQNGAYFPLDRYTAYQARTSSSLNSRRKGQVVNDLRKPATHFYNKLPYAHFDIVLHADIVEPPVQYTYNLRLECHLPPAFQDRKKEVERIIKYVWMTDKGEPRVLDLP